MTFKGVVDKNFEAVDSFHGHIRTQHGQLPQKPPQIYQLDDFLETLCLCAKISVKNGFRRITKASRSDKVRPNDDIKTLTRCFVHKVMDFVFSNQWILTLNQPLLAENLSFLPNFGQFWLNLLKFRAEIWKKIHYFVNTTLVLHIGLLVCSYIIWSRSLRLFSGFVSS